MKIFNQDKPPGSKKSPYPPIFFGLLLLGYVSYCLSNSNSDCIVTIHKSGIKEHCGDDKIWGYAGLILPLLIALVFFGMATDAFGKNKES